jgi:6-pyruvoyltetrahydropterin/6-carboxytetrahydropterin synthase
VNVSITRRYTFSAAHHLIGMRARHKCSQLHGHNYAVEVTVSGPLSNGLILDAADLDLVVGPILAELDHNDLNEVGTISTSKAILIQPSAENIATYLWAQLNLALGDGDHPRLHLVKVRVQETERLYAEVTA